MTRLNNITINCSSTGLNILLPTGYQYYTGWERYRTVNNHPWYRYKVKYVPKILTGKKTSNNIFFSFSRRTSKFQEKPQSLQREQNYVPFLFHVFINRCMVETGKKISPLCSLSASGSGVTFPISVSATYCGTYSTATLASTKNGYKPKNRYRQSV